MSKQILIVLTSHNRLGITGESTGFWLEELAVPYYDFKDAGIEVVLASPKGGQPPIDPKSEAPDSQTDETHRFVDDAAASEQLANTLHLSDVKAADYDAIFYPGGHGPLWDLVSDTHSIRLIQDFWASEKPISAVCHGPAVFVNAKTSDGHPIIAGRQVTGFSNSEEDLMGLTDVVPFLIEDTFVDQGAHYASGDDFAAFVRSDGHLITGQNPASSKGVAQELIRLLQHEAK